MGRRLTPRLTLSRNRRNPTETRRAPGTLETRISTTQQRILNNLSSRLLEQVIEVTDGAEPREQRIALSMKLVNQADGTDLDPSNAEAETDVRMCVFVCVFVS